MTSINTNNSAMAALQTLRTINDGLDKTQQAVSTGYKVSSASDNAAYWSIATTMRSDNSALGAVSDAIGLGAAKVDTAYTAMDSAIDVVTQIKAKLVTATEEGVDKGSIQDDISQLQGQLKSISGAASFNGENWLQASLGSSTASVTRTVVGSFTRDSDGNVAVKTIGYTQDSSSVLFDTSHSVSKYGILDGNDVITGSQQMASVSVVYADGTSSTSNVATADSGWLAANGFTVDNDDGIALDKNKNAYVEVSDGVWAKATTTATNNASSSAEVGSVSYAGSTYYVDTSASSISGATTATVDMGFSVSTLDVTKLDSYSAASGMSSDDVLAEMISYVDNQLSTMTSAASNLGSVSSRIDMQSNFVSSLSDSITSGVGKLVDADMEEESSKLSALQTQQQLAIQSLSIANSSSQNILSLFRG